MPSKDKIKKKSKANKEKIDDQNHTLSPEEIERILSTKIKEYKKYPIKVYRDVFRAYPNFEEGTPHNAKVLFFMCSQIVNKKLNENINCAYENYSYKDDDVLDSLIDSCSILYETYLPIYESEEDEQSYMRLFANNGNPNNPNKDETYRVCFFPGYSIYGNLGSINRGGKIKVTDTDYDYKYMINTIKDILLKREEIKNRENV